MNDVLIVLGILVVLLGLVCLALWQALHSHIKEARKARERQALLNHREELHASLKAAIPSSDSLSVRDIGKLRSLLYTLIYSSRP